MEKTAGRTSLILHGHFYQPPRENPFTGIIPKQESAAPYLDWNERIWHDCYSANAHSRYLSPEGRIISITNNFSYISYNFGPTLLSWMESEHPETIELLTPVLAGLSTDLIQDDPGIRVKIIRRGGQLVAVKILKHRVEQFAKALVSVKFPEIAPNAIQHVLRNRATLRLA